MKSRIVYTSARASKKASSRRVAFLAVVGAGMLFLAVGVVFVCRMPSAQIRRITLTGMKTLEEAVLRERIDAGLEGARAWVLPRGSFFLASAGAIASDLEKNFPRIENAAVVKKFPDALDVAITERVLWGVFCNSLESSSTPACVYIDSSGIAYEEAPELEGKLLVIVRSDSGGGALGAAVADPAVMSQMRTLIRELSDKADIMITGFILSSRVPSEIRAVSSEGFTLIFTREDDISAGLDVLKRVLTGEIKDRRNKLDYIDLRFGNKVFYKLR